MVLSIPELNSQDLKKDLESDLANLSGIYFIETSLLSRTMIINYNSRKISPYHVENILNKWGLNTFQSSFRKIYID